MIIKRQVQSINKSSKPISFSLHTNSLGAYWFYCASTDVTTELVLRQSGGRAVYILLINWIYLIIKRQVQSINKSSKPISFSLHTNSLVAVQWSFWWSTIVLQKCTGTVPRRRLYVWSVLAVCRVSFVPSMQCSASPIPAWESGFTLDMQIILVSLLNRSINQTFLMQFDHRRSLVQLCFYRCNDGTCTETERGKSSLYFIN